jgi:electron transfer flavoprotein alpha subunit
MATLVYLHTTETLGKGSLELVTYARKIDQDVTVLVTGDAPNEALETLGSYGAKEVLVNRALSVSMCLACTTVYRIQYPCFFS